MGKESWAKYGMEKGKGTAMKSGAFQESKEEGFQAALAASLGQPSEDIFKNTTKGLWKIVNDLTESARELATKINKQKSKEERESALDLAREAARKAGLQAAIAAGWEQGWKEGIIARDSKTLD